MVPAALYSSLTPRLKKGYEAILYFVGSCLATKVFIGNFPAMGRGWVIIK